MIVTDLFLQQKAKEILAELEHRTTQIHDEELLYLYLKDIAIKARIDEVDRIKDLGPTQLK